ncbi:hypothetical protein BGZ58_009642 [Dissophora ornata]|nr:hypothetical protein BGZ58_009642 [Dissophora ornata]
MPLQTGHSPILPVSHIPPTTTGLTDYQYAWQNVASSYAPIGATENPSINTLIHNINSQGYNEDLNREAVEIATNLVMGPTPNSPLLDWSIIGSGGVMEPHTQDIGVGNGADPSFHLLHGGPSAIYLKGFGAENGAGSSSQIFDDDFLVMPTPTEFDAGTGVGSSSPVPGGEPSAISTPMGYPSTSAGSTIIDRTGVQPVNENTNSSEKYPGGVYFYPCDPRSKCPDGRSDNITHHLKKAKAQDAKSRSNASSANGSNNFRT